MQIVIDKPESAYIFLQMKINCSYANQPAPGIAEHSLGLLQLQLLQLSGRKDQTLFYPQSIAEQLLNKQLINKQWHKNTLLHH